MAYYFSYEYDQQGNSLNNKQRRLVSLVEQWQKLDKKKEPHLYYETTGHDRLMIHDNRIASLIGDEPVSFEITNSRLAAVFLTLDNIVTVDDILRLLADRGITDMGHQELNSYLERLIELRLVLYEAERYLGLALPL